MTVTTQLTLEQYLRYDDGSDRQYELVDGDLVEMPPESPRNIQIVFFLISQFLGFVASSRLTNKTEIVVAGGRATAHVPDLMILTDELVQILHGVSRSTITLDMPSPLLVVEVVSPGKENEDRDYRYKRSEYAARRIGEYWIIDPAKASLTVLSLVEGLYEDRQFRGSELIRSPTFQDLNLTVEQILQSGA